MTTRDMRKLLQTLPCLKHQTQHRAFIKLVKVAVQNILRRVANVAHEAGIIIPEQLERKGEKQKAEQKNCDPERHQEKAEMQRVEKRKEITAGTMERQFEKGSLNCNKPRARRKSHTNMAYAPRLHQSSQARMMKR